jgi:gluconolactonase
LESLALVKALSENDLTRKCFGCIKVTIREIKTEIQVLEIKKALMRGPILVAAGVVVVTLLSQPCAAQDNRKAIEKSVVRLDSAFDTLISPDAEVQKIKGGFGFTEGITCVQKGNSGYVLFSDMWTNQIYKLTPDGQLSLYLDHSGYTGFDIWRVGMPSPGQEPGEDKWYQIGSNGLALDREGRLLIATWTGRSIDRIERNGKRTILADRYDGKRFGGTNDLVVKKDGAIYFTDGVGGMRGGAKDPTKELDLRGVFMLNNGKVSMVVKDMPATNGLAFSPDEKYLYVNASFRNYIRRYVVQPDDTLSNGQMFYDISDDKAPGITDGMKVDTKGNLWETAPGPSIFVISPEGKHLGTVRLPEISANLCFGDSDNQTIYIAGRTTIYKIRVKIPGIR